MFSKIVTLTAIAIAVAIIARIGFGLGHWVF